MHVVNEKQKKYSKRSLKWHNKTGILWLKSVKIAKAFRGFDPEPHWGHSKRAPRPPSLKKPYPPDAQGNIFLDVSAN